MGAAAAWVPVRRRGGESLRWEGLGGRPHEGSSIALGASCGGASTESCGGASAESCGGASAEGGECGGAERSELGAASCCAGDICSSGECSRDLASPFCPYVTPRFPHISADFLLISRASDGLKAAADAGRQEPMLEGPQEAVERGGSPRLTKGELAPSGLATDGRYTAGGCTSGG
jgi:hypothetical protein